MIIEEYQHKIKLFEYFKDLVSPEKLNKIETLSINRTRFIAPIIEDIYQFHNAGAIVRSMEAFGFQSLYALENINSFQPKTAVSRGADKWIDITYMQAGKEALNTIKNKGYKLVAVSPENNAIDIHNFQLTQPTALLFGTEFNGVAEETLKLADACIKIPMRGFTSSLNVSVAAGICFCQMRHQLENSSILDWKLNEEEILDIKINWAINSVSSGKNIALHFLNSLKK